MNEAQLKSKIIPWHFDILPSDCNEYIEIC